MALLRIVRYHSLGGGRGESPELFAVDFRVLACLVYYNCVILSVVSAPTLKKSMCASSSVSN